MIFLATTLANLLPAWCALCMSRRAGAFLDKRCAASGVASAVSRSLVLWHLAHKFASQSGQVIILFSKLLDVQSVGAAATFDRVVRLSVNCDPQRCKDISCTHVVTARFDESHRGLGFVTRDAFGGLFGRFGGYRGNLC
jgi:hypothetical protein